MTARSRVPAVASTSLRPRPPTTSSSPSPSEFSMPWNLHAVQGWAQRRCEAAQLRARSVVHWDSADTDCGPLCQAGRLPLSTEGEPRASGPRAALRPAGPHQLQIHIVPPLPQLLGASR